MKLSLREKVLLTILLAVTWSWLSGCRSKEHWVSIPSPADGTTDAAYLKHIYADYNEGYFQNKLTRNVVIDMLEPDQGNMASTYCEPDGSCVIHFNPKYTAAPRIADQTMLHEQCHVKTWMLDMKLGQQDDHGRLWRACMINLDTQGAFRELIIDNYSEQM
jgi:hypothetical protein